MNTFIQNSIVELINNANTLDKPLTLNEISLSDPVPDSSTTANTKVNVSAIDGSGYIGNVDIFYNRVDLSELGIIELLSDIPYNQSVLADEINSIKQSHIAPDDLEDVLFPVMHVGDITNVELIAKQKSLGWIGQNTATVLFGFNETLTNPLHHLMNVTLPTDNYLQ